MITTILSVATGFFSMIAAAKTTIDSLSNKEQLEQIAEVFRQIADTLDQVVAEFQDGKTPHGACQALAHYATILPSVTSGILEPMQVSYYSGQLMEVHNVEQLQLSLHQGDRDTELAELQKAAGLFRASSYTIVI